MMRLSGLALLVLLMACAPGTIPGVKIFENQASHVTGRIDYPQNPPAGGAHNPVWQNCRAYDRPLYDEYAVHSLNTARCGFCTAKVSLLTRSNNSKRRSVASPPYCFPPIQTFVHRSSWLPGMLNLTSTRPPIRASSNSSGNTLRAAPRLRWARPAAADTERRRKVCADNRPPERRSPREPHDRNGLITPFCSGRQPQVKEASFRLMFSLDPFRLVRMIQNTLDLKFSPAFPMVYRI